MAISSITMKFDHIAKSSSQEKQMVNINSNKTKIFQIMKYLPKKKNQKLIKIITKSQMLKLKKFLWFINFLFS